MLKRLLRMTIAQRRGLIFEVVIQCNRQELTEAQAVQALIAMTDDHLTYQQIALRIRCRVAHLVG